ncbi:MAG: hypothetical protein EA407_05150 [Rhodobacteraceae bacterium]|nr:MAG: hypothetical protein EA407_05150 [Paracoccaceae bacterium]
MTRHRLITRVWRRFGQSETGSATIEFVVLFPLVMSILLMGAESGWVMVQRVSLERAVDLSVRDIRLGRLAYGTTQEEFRSELCARANLLSHCDERLLIEMRRIDMQSWNFPQEPARCIDLSEPIAPPTIFTIAGSEALMLLRVCYLVRPIFPTTRLGLQLPLDGSGMFSLRTVSGFVTE